MTTSPCALPSREALALERASWRELERVFQLGTLPEVESLVGWEFRGINRLPVPAIPVAQIAGIKKFVKGFVREPGGRVVGYNVAVRRGTALDGRWEVATRRYGHYEVRPVDPTARDNAYLHALFLDYGAAAHPIGDPTRRLRDYLVQVSPANSDLYLGKAYYAVGPLRVGTLNYFVLERHRPVAPA